MREIADQRKATGALRRLDGRPPSGHRRELIRPVQIDATSELDTNSYSVPWRLIDETIKVVVADGPSQHPSSRR
jgi:hypothetical protein